MYGYKQYIPLNTEEILKRVSQEDIFKVFIKDDIRIGTKYMYKAPYRDDNTAGCYFHYYNEFLQFVDYADVVVYKGCFKFTEVCIKGSHYDSLLFLNHHFNLGLGVNLEPTKKIINKVQKKVIDIPDVNKTIIYLKRNFNNTTDKNFWFKYNITKEQLVEDKVVPIVLYRGVNSKNKYFTVTTFDITYAYTDFEDNRCKIYRPYAGKKEKWFTNCTKDDIGCINSLPIVGDLLIITKSYKDCRVIRNLGYNSVWFQNEGMIPNIKTLKSLTKRFDRVKVLYDNDSTGQSRCKIVSEYINSIYPGKASYMFLPPKLLLENIKDPSDLVASKGEKTLLEYLTNNI